MPSPGEDIQSWSKIADNNGTADPSIDWHEFQTRASVNNSSRSELAAHAKNRDLNNGSIVTTGSPNAQNFLSGVGYTSMPPRISATLKVGGGLTNTGPMTLNMDGISAIQVKTETGGALRGGEFVDGHLIDLLYDGTSWLVLDAVFDNPILTGDPQAPTPTDPLDNDKSIATTEWVQGLVYGGAGIVVGVRVFSTPGTYSYVPNSLMKSCIIECIGAGGGGGGGACGTLNDVMGGGGGGGGGYSRKFATATDIGPSKPVGVGFGGASGGGGTPGGSGGQSSVGSLCIAFGGGGASFASPVSEPAGGLGAAAGIGDVAIPGSPGEFGLYNVGGATVTSVWTAASGGVGPLGGGGQPAISASASDAVGYGGGGGGGVAYGPNSVTVVNGGTGAGGLVIITEFQGAGQPGPQGPIGATGPIGPTGGTFADAPSNGTLYGRINAAWAAAQPADADLTSLASASGTNTIYYRSAANTWSAVTVGTGLTFSGGTLAASLFSNVAQGEVPASGGGTANYLRADGTWTTPPGTGGTIAIGSTPISGGTSGNYLYNNGALFGEKTPTQVTADLNVFSSTLKGLAPASGGGTSNFLRADGTWTAPSGAGAGNVSTSGTPAANQWAQWTDSTHIQGVDASGTPWVLKAGDTMSGDFIISKNAPTLELRKTAATQLAGIYGRNGTSIRWTMYLGESTTESGSNVGSNFQLNRYDDSGVSLGSVLTIARNTGLATVAADPTAALGIATKQYADTKASGTLPTQQIFTSGSGTYTTPANCRRIEITIVGGGGGGSGSGTGAGTGVAGANTTFGSGPLCVAGGGGGGIFSTGNGGAGGTASGAFYDSVAGGGGGPFAGQAGALGGNSSRGGAGGGLLTASSSGIAAAANSGSGGGAASGLSGGGGGAGGGAGATLWHAINSPAGTYSYTVGGGGGGGTAGTSGAVGGAGAAGIIIVKEIY